MELQGRVLRENLNQDFDREAARRRAYYTRAKSLEHLDRHLIDFETHFTRHNGKMLWAPDIAAGKQELLKLCNGAAVVTYKHRLLDELGLGRQAGWIFMDEEPEHLPAEYTAIVFPQFYISENGSFVLADNRQFSERLLSGASRLFLCMGIEQVCPTLNEAENLMLLLSRSSDEQKEFHSVHFCFGNRQYRERSGPLESWAVLLDNGRSNILAEIPQRQALYCIHCNACRDESNFIPLPGRHESVIERIRAPFVEGPAAFERSFQIPLSGRATAVCPVGIDLKTLILENRRMAIEKKQDAHHEVLAWKAWKTAMLSRRWMNQKTGMKNFTLKSFFKKAWGEQREFPRIANQSFNEWWLAERGKEEL